jgi:protein TonB
MFEQSTLSSGPASKRILGTCLGFAGQAVFVSVAVLAPMLFPQILPRTTLTSLLVAPGAPPPPPGKPAFRPRGEQRPTAQLVHGVPVLPVVVPPRAEILVDPEPETHGDVMGIPGGVGRGGGGGSTLVDRILTEGTPTPPPPRPTVVRTDPDPRPVPAQIQRVRVSRGVNMAKLLHRVEPIYPALARQMRVSGVVELEGIIGTDGRLKELRVVSGHMLLAKAALDAVRQWIYEPTRLNGIPVEVIAPITVTFILN